MNEQSLLLEAISVLTVRKKKENDCHLIIEQLYKYR